jgi:hypothetical protein
VLAEDTFNLYGIRESVPHYKEGMSLVRDFAAGELRRSRDGVHLHCRRFVPLLLPDSDPEPDAWNGEYFEAAKNVYGLIHARFIITEKGMQLMASGNCAVSCVFRLVSLRLIAYLGEDLRGELVWLLSPDTVRHAPAAACWIV